MRGFVAFLSGERSCWLGDGTDYIWRTAHCAGRPPVSTIVASSMGVTRACFLQSHPASAVCFLSRQLCHQRCCILCDSRIFPFIHLPPRLDLSTDRYRFYLMVLLLRYVSMDCCFSLVLGSLSFI